MVLKELEKDGDYTIQLETSSNKYFVYEQGSRYGEYSSFSAAQGVVSRLAHPQEHKEKKRVNVIIWEGMDSWGSFEQPVKGIATSFKIGWLDLMLRVSVGTKNKEYRLRDVFQDLKENEAVFSELEELQKERVKLNEKINQKEKELKRFSDKELGKVLDEL